MTTKKTFSLRLLSLLLVVFMTLGLCACPLGEPAVTTGTSGTSGTSGTTSGKPSTDHPDDVTDVIYANGAAIDEAGASLAEGSFALTPHAPDTANAVEKDSLARLFRSGITEGATYKITASAADAVSNNGRDYAGKGAIIIAPNGIIFKDCTNVKVLDLTIVGEVQIQNCQNLTFERVDIQNPNSTAVKIDEKSDGVTFTDCRLDAKTAIDSLGANLAVLDSYLRFDMYGIDDRSGLSGTTVINSVFKGEGLGEAIAVTAANSYIRENTFDLVGDGITVNSENAVNGLIALNEIRGAQRSVYVLNAKNISVVLNSAISVIVEESHAVYVVDNSLGGRLRAKNTDYLLADGNTFPEDTLDHSTLQSGNTNTNGDNVTDVDARLDVGADEDLLPHVNLDLFVGMEHFDAVREPGNLLTAEKYISQKAKTDKYVIVAPGLYDVSGPLTFDATANDTVVYGYGACLERVREGGNSLGNRVTVTNASNISLKGLTLGFERQSCGQVYVLDKIERAGEFVLKVVTGAGMDNEFGNTNTALYNINGMGAQREGTFYAYCDTSFKRIVKLTNGLMEMEVSESVYNMILEGDILTCRAVDGDRSFVTSGSSDIVYKDLTVYGGAAGFAFVENSNHTATTYYRVANTTKSGFVIDKDTYDRYRALEEEYGVSLEISVDDLGRYRGSPAHIGSIDATHTIMCAQGSVAISCIFENMCDDATNQRHEGARLASIVDNGDGTSTVTYRGSWSVYSRQNFYAGFRYGTDFHTGDRVYIYTSDGQLVCDSTALSPTVRTGTYKTDEVMKKYFEDNNKPVAGSSLRYEFRTVQVKTADVNMEALEGFDLAAEGADDDQKVIVDNMSYASNGFIFDNCRMQNIRSRGLLIKASEGKIINCTFRNIGMACAAILYEIYWGESGVSENLEIARNIMDHTGYFIRYTSGNEDRYSPVSIEGLGSRVDEDYLLYKNIRIVDNVIRNRTTEYAVYVNSARDITITGNEFGDYVDGEGEEHFSRAIHINGGMNIKIEGNTYSSFNLPIEEKIIAKHNKNIYGADVEYNGEKIIKDSE